MRIGVLFLLVLSVAYMETVRDNSSDEVGIKVNVCLTLSRELSKSNETYANAIKHMKFHRRISQIVSFGLLNCFNSITKAQIINLTLALSSPNAQDSFNIKDYSSLLSVNLTEELRTEDFNQENIGQIASLINSMFNDDNAKIVIDENYIAAFIWIFIGLLYFWLMFKMIKAIIACCSSKPKPKEKTD